MTQPFWKSRLFIATVAALALIAIEGPTLDFLIHSQQKHAALLTETEQKRARDLAQLRADAMQAEQLSTTLSPDDARTLCAPSDRLALSTLIERAAGASDLGPFSYSLGPEQIVDGLLAGSSGRMALSALTIQADAPEDLSVFAFLSTLSTHFPGRLRIQSLDITRTNKGGNTQLGATNIHATARLEWLSNPSDSKEKP